jgi:hypothetical protein
MAEGQTIPKLYMVIGMFNDNIYGKHTSYTDASKQASDLCKTAPDKDFIVFEAVTRHKAVLMVESIPMR